MDRKPTAEEHALFAMMRILDGGDDTAGDVLDELLADFMATELRQLAKTCERLMGECGRELSRRGVPVAAAIARHAAEAKGPGGGIVP